MRFGNFHGVIHFTVEGEEFTAEEGLTWLEWLRSCDENHPIRDNGFFGYHRFLCWNNIEDPDWDGDITIYFTDGSAGDIYLCSPDKKPVYYCDKIKPVAYNGYASWEVLF